MILLCQLSIFYWIDIIKKIILLIEYFKFQKKWIYSCIFNLLKCLILHLLKYSKVDNIKNKMISVPNEIKQHFTKE